MGSVFKYVHFCIIHITVKIMNEYLTYRIKATPADVNTTRDGYVQMFLITCLLYYFYIHECVFYIQFCKICMWILDNFYSIHAYYNYGALISKCCLYKTLTILAAKYGHQFVLCKYSYKCIAG